MYSLLWCHPPQLKTYPTFIHPLSCTFIHLNILTCHGPVDWNLLDTQPGNQNPAGPSQAITTEAQHMLVGMSVN